MAAPSVLSVLANATNVAVDRRRRDGGVSALAFIPPRQPQARLPPPDLDVQNGEDHGAGGAS